MEFREFAVLAKAMKSAYAQQSFLSDGDSVKVWYEMLKDLPYAAVSVAVKKHIMTNRFPPTVAELRETVAEGSGGKPWSEAWGDVLKAMRRYGAWRPKEAMDMLDEHTRKIVQRLGGIENLSVSENITADRANFRMMYEESARHEKEQRQIPGAVHMELEALTANAFGFKQIGGSTDE